MGKILYMVHVSIDGRIEGPNGEFDWPMMGPELSAYGDTVNAGVDAFLYGRVVWEMMASYWPNAEQISDDPHDLKFAPLWRRMPKVVFSRTLEKADWDARVISGDLAEQVPALKKEFAGDLLVTGGAGLAGALTDLGLIDEYLVVVHPVVLGGGKPAFAAPAERFGVRLVESRVLDGRTVLLRYAR